MTSFEARQMALRLLAARRGTSETDDPSLFAQELRAIPIDGDFLGALITELVSITELSVALAADALDIKEEELVRKIEKARDDDEEREIKRESEVERDVERLIDEVEKLLGNGGDEERIARGI